MGLVWLVLAFHGMLTSAQISSELGPLGPFGPLGPGSFETDLNFGLAESSLGFSDSPENFGFGRFDDFGRLDDIESDELRITRPNFPFRLPLDTDLSVEFQNQQLGHPRNHYRPPKPRYDPPKPQYGPPKPQYGPPKSQYGPPKPQYGPPKPQYGPPKPHYGPPKPQYTPLKPNYGPPKTHYAPPKPHYGAPKPHHLGSGKSSSRSHKLRPKNRRPHLRSHYDSQNLRFRPSQHNLGSPELQLGVRNRNFRPSKPRYRRPTQTNLRNSVFGNLRHAHGLAQENSLEQLPHHLDRLPHHLDRYHYHLNQRPHHLNQPSHHLDKLPHHLDHFIPNLDQRLRHLDQLPHHLDRRPNNLRHRPRNLSRYPPHLNQHPSHLDRNPHRLNQHLYDLQSSLEPQDLPLIAQHPLLPHPNPLFQLGSSEFEDISSLPHPLQHSQEDRYAYGNERTCAPRYVTKYQTKYKQVPIYKTLVSKAVVTKPVYKTRYDTRYVTKHHTDYVPQYVTSTEYIPKVTHITDYKTYYKTHYQTDHIPSEVYVSKYITKTYYVTTHVTDIIYKTKYETDYLPQYVTKTTYHTDKANPSYITVTKTDCPTKGY